MLRLDVPFCSYLVVILSVSLVFFSFQNGARIFSVTKTTTSQANPEVSEFTKSISEDKSTAHIDTNELSSSDADNRSTLRQVTVVFRHGQRTPADTYPNDPYINHTMAPYGWGQLTNEGKVNQYKQGLWLRKRYNNLLGSIYNPGLFYLQTTAVDRAQMSGLLEAAALWKPTSSQSWNDELLWQPVPLHYQPLDSDTLLLVRTSCPAYYKELERVKNSSEIWKINRDNKELYDVLANLTGKTIKDVDDIMDLYGTLRAEADFNLTLPEWTRDFYPEPISTLTKFSYLVNVYTPLLRRLKGGPFLKKILSDMRSTINGRETRKMFMYGGHDSTITNLLGTMQVWDAQMPDYNIMTMIELHQDDAGWNVQIFLRNTTSGEPHQLTVPGCRPACPVEEFVKLLDDVIPTDWESECLIDDTDYVPPAPLPP